MIGIRGLAVVTAACIASAASAGAPFQTVTVDFDDQAGGIPPVVTDGDFSPFVTFTTSQDSVLLIFSGAGVVGTSSPNTLTAALSPDAAVYDSDIYMDFTMPVNNLSLNIAADNDSGVIADLVVTHSLGMTTLDVIGNGNLSDPIPVDLSAYIDVESVQLINITDEFGLAIDDLVFDVPIPAPATLAVLLGVAGIGRSRRRR
jgi:hypothetical protein